MLVGRDPERALLAALLAEARHGTARSLVVRGEPGVGKTALLDALVAEGDGAVLLRTQGLEVEAPLAFAALHRLLRPLSRLRAHLPPPQARALAIAFGEDDGPSVEPFLVGVATLSLLTAAAEETPLLCVVDDAHWLDPASAGALLFCARRLGADRVVMVFGARDGAAATFEAPGLAEVTLTGLDVDAARALLATRLAGEPADEVAQRLIAETSGNPLALLELPGELTAAQLEGTAALPTTLHLTARVERAFLDRSRQLAGPVQRVLLLAAADDTGELDVLRRAGGQWGLDEAVMQEAFDSGLLVDQGGSMSLRHPLVRSAIYQSAAGMERRGAHRALAEALAGSGHNEREIWHRAKAAEGRDEDLVDSLEGVGEQSQRRGGHVAALAAYERAAELSGDAVRRARLSFAAGRSAWACGQAARAQAFLSAAREGTDDPLLQCDVARLRGHIEVNIGSAAEAHRVFVDAAHAVLPVDPVRALDIGVAAAVMRTFGADSGTPLRSEDLLTATTADTSPRTRCLQQMLGAMTLVADADWAAAMDALDVALEIGKDVDDRDVLWNLGNAALQLGDEARQQQFYSFALSRAREAGAATAVIYCLQRLCFGYWTTGDHVALRVSAEEAVALGANIGQSAVTALPIAWLVLLAAQRDRDDYDELLQHLEGVVAAHPLGIMADPVHDLTRWAMGVRAASAGDTSGAFHQLGRLRLPVLQRLAATERIEAAVRAGEVGTALAWTDELATFAEATGRPWALSAVSFGRAVTAETGAERLFEEALAHGSRGDRPVDVARVQLAYGEWLRRSQRRVDARVHLRRSFETFQDVRAEALASRADQELRASGETARKRDPSTLLQLTPTELKIAQLVSSGLSNKDVAAQCWISPRTVAFHLRNVFAKAGVTSRGELARLDLA
ncbi:LuxR family transcriptional regulator [Nocardioides sp.]|uniref:helix-turn-helix transcriptional regulator n=1 Tax=Nocardioides sp. TaxID=35761 RepID=UPI002629FDA9|nr:LuxR family transcriptional regulator [Nocardioides sp.]MCW2737937.1 helix-turn-helix transcriptional regulator [Nocardioides sp.]